MAESVNDRGGIYIIAVQERSNPMHTISLGRYKPQVISGENPEMKKIP